MKIINMNDYSLGIEEAVKYYHDKWGNDKNFSFFHDAIVHSSGSDSGSGLPIKTIGAGPPNITADRPATSHGGQARHKSRRAGPPKVTAGKHNDKA